MFHFIEGDNYTNVEIHNLNGDRRHGGMKNPGLSQIDRILVRIVWGGDLGLSVGKSVQVYASSR